MLTTEQHIEQHGFVLLPPYEQPNTVLFDDAQLSAVAHQDIVVSTRVADEAAEPHVTLRYPEVADAAMFRVLGRLGSQEMADQPISNDGQPIVVDESGRQAVLAEYVQAAAYSRHGDGAAALGVLMFLRQDPSSEVYAMARDHVASKLQHYLASLEADGN